LIDYYDAAAVVAAVAVAAVDDELLNKQIHLQFYDVDLKHLSD
jgi:hypothetical protein